VTGAAGFIGSHVVEELLSRRVPTIAVDDFSAGKAENLAHLQESPFLRIAKADVSSREQMEPLVAEADVIFHQAASKKTVCLRDPVRDLHVNAQGALVLLLLSVKHGVKKFVHASTGSVYGEARFRPQNEEHPLAPTSYYGVSKLAGERYVRAFGDLHGLDTTILRYFHVYGPRQESTDVGGVVSIFARRLVENKPLTIYGDGTQQRSFTYVKDVVRANLASACSAVSRGQVYNCASGMKVTVGELASILAEMLNARLEVNYADWQPGDIRVFDIDNQKIRRELGIEFLTDFRAGLKPTLEWAVQSFATGSGETRVQG
jgi:nucleoside-diphosphate-sugar epimerase